MKFFTWLTLAIVGFNLAAGESSLHTHPHVPVMPERDRLRFRVLLCKPRRKKRGTLTMQSTNPNQHALDKMAEAQLAMAHAFSLYEQLTDQAEASFAAFQEAYATSINQNCPQYQRLIDEFSAAYGELFGALKLLMVPFNHPQVSRMIRAGQEQSKPEQPA